MGRGIFVAAMLLASALAATLPAQPLGETPVGTLPVEVPTAGVPEAGVLAGLPIVERLPAGDLRFELKVRLREQNLLRRDATDLRMHLNNASGDPGRAQLASSLRLGLVGALNRLATIETRIAAVERELGRRRGLAR
ncbi:MAG: hypothetical protein HY816_21940 [Candidatus Wallbacteria bacterium]|nr:hypothetical protein [Candidatus Wallbacteria bacterium]